jgi:hypothetical protein
MRGSRGFGEIKTTNMLKMNVASLFRLFTELIVLLLGGLLILLGVSGHVSISARPSTLMGLGLLFAYLGVRAWTKPEPDATRLQLNLRAASLLFVGALMFATPYVSPQYSSLPLILAGSVLAVRGLIGSLLSLRGS